MATTGQREHFAHFELRRLLGRGGMGEVYEAWDTRLGRRVALKLMRSSLLTAGLGDQLIREARAAARVEHPHVVRIYGIHEAEGQVAIEMEFIAGASLRELMRSGPLPMDQAAQLLEQVLEALHACHDAGIVHCDLKPANVLVTPAGHAYLTDFGIACGLHGEARSPSSPEALDQAWGTPRYAAPEAGAHDCPAPRWDLYAAGVMMHDVVAGYGAPLATVSAISGAISPALESLLDDLAALNPAERPESAAAALARLRETPEHQLADLETAPIPPLPAPADPVSARPVPSLRRNHHRTWLLLAGQAMLVIIGAVVLMLTRQTAEVVTPLAQSPPSQSPAEAAVPEPDPTLPPVYVRRAPQGLSLRAFDLYFSYDDGTHGRELWAYRDGSFIMADIHPGPLGSNPRNFWFSRNGVFFCAETDAEGAEPWVASSEPGRPLHTAPLGDLNPGPMGSNPLAVYSHENLVLFYAQNYRYGLEPWATAGLPESTAMVADLHPGIDSSAPMKPRALADASGAWIVAICDANVGMTLCRYQYDTNSITKLARVAADTASMAECGPLLLLMNQDQAHGREPWVYDQRNGSFTMLKDVNPGPASSDPGEFFTFGIRVLFQAQTVADGLELWISDGTAEGTSLVADINPGPADSDPYGYTVLAERAYFRARTEEAGRELWCTDGTGAGTALVADVWPGPNSAEPYNLSTDGTLMFFTANDGVHGEELWVDRQSDGIHEASLVADLWPGSQSAEPRETRWWVDGLGYFIAYLPPGKADLVELRVQQERVSTRPLGLPEHVAQENMP